VEKSSPCNSLIPSVCISGLFDLIKPHPGISSILSHRAPSSSWLRVLSPRPQGHTARSNYRQHFRAIRACLSAILLCRFRHSSLSTSLNPPRTIVEFGLRRNMSLLNLLVILRPQDLRSVQFNATNPAQIRVIRPTVTAFSIPAVYHIHSSTVEPSGCCKCGHTSSSSYDNELSASAA